MTKTEAESVSEIMKIIKKENINNFFNLMNYLNKNEPGLFRVSVDNPDLVIILCDN